MLYFCKKGYAYHAKNNLHRAVQKETQRWDGLLVMSPVAFGQHLAKLAETQNLLYPRSRAVEKRERFSADLILNQKVFIFSLQEVNTSEATPVVQFTFYPVVGEFIDQPGEESVISIWQYCRQCGCTEMMACEHTQLGSCWWTQEATPTQGPLCSHCELENQKKITAADIQRPWKEVSHE